MMALTKSARAWLERRMFGTVRNDLNLATTAITKPLQQADTKVNMVVNPLIISLVKNGFSEYISLIFFEHFLWLTFGHSRKANESKPFSGLSNTKTDLFRKTSRPFILVFLKEP